MIVKTKALRHLANENAKRNPFPLEKQETLKKQLSQVNKLMTKQNASLEKLRKELGKQASPPPAKEQLE